MTQYLPRLQRSGKRTPARWTHDNADTQELVREAVFETLRRSSSLRLGLAEEMERQNMRQDDARLHEIAGAILDGSAVDWASAESCAADESVRRVIGEMKVIAEIASVHSSAPLVAATSATATLSDSSLEQQGPEKPATWNGLRLLEKVGQGAYGEVYRGWDTRLDREVALKLLPVSLADGDARGTSIIEEGRLLAKVHHANVVTIYGAERIENRIGLWMEFVRGRTLEQVLEQGNAFSAADAIDIGIELCHAVSAVHDAGLLHLDIKTHNVMVADTGRVVLMDFGSGRELGTGSGSLAGTPLYVPPELLRGEAITVRSDIYSLGVVLYHLLTGTYPVLGRSVSELRVAHERRDRIDVRAARPDVSPKLARVIERAIDPQPERRYPSADALRADLAAVRRSPRVLRFAYALGAVAALVAAAGALVWTTPPTPVVAGLTPRSHVAVRIAPVTSLPGGKASPTLSPDGHRVAFAWDRGDGFNIYVKGVDSDATVQLTRAPGGGAFPAWSPDGRFIAFLRRLPAGAGDWRDAVLIVPALGGSERTLWSERLPVAGTGLDWSPDGQHLVVCARSTLGMPYRLLLVSVATDERRWVSSPPRASAGDSYPIFSPDGHSIAFVRDSGSESGLYVVSVTGGEPRRLTTASSQIRRPAWTSDGQSLIFTSFMGAGRSLLRRVTVSGGEPEPVTDTGEGASDPSTARHEGRLVFTQNRLDQNLYRADLPASDMESVTKLAATTREDAQADISPDGSRIAFVSDRTGHSEIWVMDSSGMNPAPVTDLKTGSRHPRWSRDGRRIAFSARISGASHPDIHVVGATGGLPQRLTADAANDMWPTWSADGRWIYFMSDRNGIREIWRVPAGGGRAEQVTKGGGLKAWESPDGRFLYYSNDAPAIWRVATGGGKPTLLFRLPPLTPWGGEWVLADSGIYWLNKKASARSVIDFFSFATGSSTRTVTLPGVFDDGGGFSVSPDGRWLVFGQRDYHGSDIMMIEGLQ